MAGVISINLPKCTDLDYINFIIAASTVFSCTEAAHCYPSITNAPSHDCFTRLLQKQPSDTEPLWDEVSKFVTPKGSQMHWIWMNPREKIWLTSPGKLKNTIEK